MFVKGLVRIVGKKKALYVDIDGTLARFHDADKMFIEAMWTSGFYLYLKPFENLVEAVRMFARKHPEVEVFALSAVLDTDPPFVVGEKNAWLNHYVPEIEENHRIFSKAGDDKSKYIDMERYDCFLLDDYNKNLYEFEAAGGHSIKFHNDVNHRGLGEFGGSKGNLWTGDLVHHYDSPEKICRDLEEMVFGKSKDEIENGIDPEPEKNPDFVIEDDVLVEYLGHDEKVVIPEGVREIGINAFWNNQELRHVVFPESLEKIGNGAFAGVDLEQLILPKNLKAIGRHAFEGCGSLEYVRIPVSVEYLHAQAFAACRNLKGFEVDKNNVKFFHCDGVVYRRHSYGVSVQMCPSGASGEVILSRAADFVGKEAFMDCSGVSKVCLPDDVLLVHSRAFAYCGSLEEMDLPTSLEQLGDEVFWGCRNLKSVAIPDGLQHIGSRIFDGCHNLTEIVISDKALVEYCRRFDFLHEVFMLPCFEALCKRYEALVQGGLDAVIEDAQARAGVAAGDEAKVVEKEAHF